jgi:iron(III) transport system permease protein
MVTVIAGFQFLVGERRLRRENRVAMAAPAAIASAPLGQEKTA